MRLAKRRRFTAKHAETTKTLSLSSSLVCDLDNWGLFIRLIGIARTGRRQGASVHEILDLVSTSDRQIPFYLDKTDLVSLIFFQ